MSAIKTTRTFALLLPALALQAQPPTWKFAVSGDSRNCGDIVMPAIAAGVHRDAAAFYWHLGDFRAIYTFDEDIVPPASLNLSTKPLSIYDYEAAAWPDFIAHQMVPFGNTPVYLTPGNHETIAPATRQAYLIQFADWIGSPAVRQQRLADDAADHALHSYYHWTVNQVDFIALDNASTDQFEAAQLAWFHAVLARDEASATIRTVVVGMHAALPGSVGASHSMIDWAQGQVSGREVYEALLHTQDTAHKKVYVVASHSHFYMDHVYRTPTWKDKELPGWIVGTAGAVRYRLPADAPTSAMTDVYGYLLATVAADGAIQFDFQKIGIDELRRVDGGKYDDSLIRWCVDANRQ